MQGYFRTGDYATRRANRDRDKKIAAFKKLVSQNMESIRAGSSKSIVPTSQIVSRLWNGILAQASRQLDPQGARIQEYRTENPN
ncbi:MAG: hypothetical protein EZS28_012282 [Streblomastix strix]|uniref:Uncharacterized protein n=1 Tax=Streblomastix strix TaxID=222440 RepID=A0A5J4WCA5_9EUKA|nr:MAG: hypothetical protein EZS28_012282 [Streblomastix strix]